MTRGIDFIIMKIYRPFPEWPPVFVVVAGCLFFLSSQIPLVFKLLTSAPLSRQYVVNYKARPNKPGLAIPGLISQSASVDPEGRIVLRSQEGGFLSFQWEYPKKEMINLHLNAWQQGPGLFEIKIIDLTRRKSKVIMNRSRYIHLNLNLTEYLKPESVYQLKLISRSQKPESGAVIDEISLGKVRGVGPPLTNDPSFIPFLGLALFLILLIYYRGTGKVYSHKRSFEFDVMAAIIGLGIILRWKAWIATIGNPLEGDAIGYWNLTRLFDWRSPFENGIREPVFIWTQFIGGKILGPHPYQFRLLSMLSSIGVIALSYHLSALLSNNKSIGLIAAGVLSAGQFVVWNSVRGERAETYLFLILLYIFLSLKLTKGSYAREIWLGLLAGLCALTWIIGSVACTLGYLYRIFRFKLSLGRVFLFFATLSVCLGPYLFRSWKKQGDPFIAINAHTNFYKNARMAGSPSYEGNRDSWIHFLLKEEGIRSYGVHLFNGYVNLFMNPKNPFNKIFLGFHYEQPWSFFLYPFLLIGIIVATIKKQIHLFAIAFSILNGAPAYLNLVRDPRIFLPAAPLIAFFFSLGLWNAFFHIKKWASGKAS